MMKTFKSKKLNEIFAKRQAKIDAAKEVKKVTKKKPKK
jgi:hypothetical protein